MKQFLIAIDQLINALIGGYADETLSARAHREGWRARRLIDILFWFDADHCATSYVSELERRQLPPEYRG